MLNRIEKLFSEKKNNILSIYFTAGFPALDNTVTIIQTLEKAGVDMIEIGIPFSDPLADGPVIQHSSTKALQNGMTLPRLFKQLKDIRTRVHIPLLLMGYLNPVLQYGVRNFCCEAAEAGIDGVIIPDLPVQEYTDHYKFFFDQYNLSPIFLVTPQSSEGRIRKIDEISNGFIYVVSSASTTGHTVNTEQSVSYFQHIQQMKLTHPALIGFGISDKHSFDNACRYANGAIIGSAFIRAIDNSENIQQSIISFIDTIR